MQQTTPQVHKALEQHAKRQQRIKMERHLADSAGLCSHCTGAGWVMSKRDGFVVDLCKPCRGNGVPDAPPAPARRLSLRERFSYSLVRWLCALRTSA